MIRALRQAQLYGYLVLEPASSTTLAAVVLFGEDAVRPARQQSREVGLPDREWQVAQVLAIKSKDIEGVKQHLIIVLARVQGVEIRDAVDAEHHSLAIDHELVVLVLQRGFDDPGISAAPVVAVAAEQALTRIVCEFSRCGSVLDVLVVRPCSSSAINSRSYRSSVAAARSRFMLFNFRMPRRTRLIR
jgi:hypothetical protein